MFRWRKMTWVLVLWTVLMAVWIGVGSSQASGVPEDCKDNTYLSVETCNEAADAGTAIGVGLLVVFWMLGFFVLALIWLMSRPRTQHVTLIRDERRS